MEGTTAYIIGFVVGQLFGLVLGSLAGALIVQYATRAVAKFKPGYWTAFKAVIIAGICGYVIGFIGGFTIAVLGGSIGLTETILMAATGFFLTAFIYGFLLKHPTDGEIGFVNGAMIALIQLLVFGIIFGTIVGIFFLVS